jgi:hypothetical protein
VTEEGDGRPVTEDGSPRERPPGVHEAACRRGLRLARKKLTILPLVKRGTRSRLLSLALASFALASCAPRVLGTARIDAKPDEVVSLPMRYLVGWPRVEIAGETMDWPRLRLRSADPQQREVPGEELSWIEDKILEFRVPRLPPGSYQVVIHDDKGPPGDRVYAILETTAYLLFPPVWPFVFRKNYAELTLRVLPP